MIKFLQTPSKAKKIVLGGLLLLICAAMVITLIPGGFLGDAFGFGGGGAGVLAKVGDEQVTLTEAQQSARQMARQQFPRGVPSQLMPFLTQRAVEGLIMQKALLMEASRMGLKVTNDELRETLQRVFATQLFPNGNFVGDEMYADFVQQNFQMSVPQFETEFKNSLLMNKLRNIVEGTATVSEQDLLQEYNRRNTKVKFEYAVLTYDDILKQIKPTDAELRAYFEKNKELYKNAVPEKRKAEYVVIDTAKVKDKVQVTPEDVKRYYSQRQDQYRVPEEVNLRQILIRTPAGADGKVDSKGIDAARAKAQEVLSKLKAGGNFAELAKKYSEDTATAKSGGEVGWVRRGQTMPEIDKAAFSLNKGQTSDIIQTSLGLFIIQVADKHAAGLKPLEEVRPQIEPIIAQEKASREAEILSNGVQTQARTAGMQAAAQKYGLELVSTGLFTTSDSLPGVGTAPELMQAMFQSRENSPAETVKIPDGYAVFRVTAVQPPSAPTFEEIKARVESDFKNERAGAMLAEKTQQLADRAHAEHNLKTAAKEVGATVKTSESVTSQSQVPDIGSMSGPGSVAFTLKPGEISGPVQAGRNGVVISLLEKQEPPSAEFAKEKDQVREQVLAQKRSEMMELFASSLRERMEKEGKIRIYKNELDRITARGGTEGD
ncbi:MAG TPA: peptidyl-prolyl cis-trans isomerase [Terriglobales bacterium]|nr:peptidyl-prolyl cis-trans isomerase [Terriglobales bacterium]